MLGDDTVAQVLETIAADSCGRDARSAAGRPTASADRAPTGSPGAPARDRSTRVACRPSAGAGRARRSTPPTSGDARTVDERLVVVAVVEKPQVGEQVDDLLLAEVAAAGRTVRRKTSCPERLLVRLGARPRREQERDIARCAPPSVHELMDAARDVPRLRDSPADLGVAVARLVGHEHLDGRASERLGERRPASVGA